MSESQKRPSMLDSGRPNSLRTLRAAHRTNLDYASFFLEFQEELAGESDRATMILAAAHLDDLLMFRIADSRPFDLSFDKDFPWLFRHEGPLGTFSHRMEIACLFGLIDDETYQQLDIVRELRNICAHSKQPVRFSDVIVRNYAKRLFEPSVAIMMTAAWAEKHMKSAFIAEVSFIAACVSGQTREEVKAVLQEAYEIASHAPSQDTRHEQSPRKNREAHKGTTPSRRHRSSRA